MNLLFFESLPPWVMLLSIGAHLGAGIVLGILYFRAVWWNARLFAMGGHATTAVAVVIGRFVLLGGLLTLASMEGALPLMAMAFGMLVVRFAVMRRVREAIP